MSSEKDRQRERERYASLSPEEKRAKGKRSNELKKARLERAKKLEAQALLLRRAARDRYRKKYGGEPLLDLTPFRMWLIGKHQQYGSVKVLAEILGMDDSRLRKYLNGYTHETTSGAPDWCGPTPITSISIDVVDKALSREGSIRLDDLYPHIDDWDS